VFLTCLGIAILGMVCGLFMKEHVLYKDLARRGSSAR